jgi:uncharacterized membrane-anchored protein YhcB (DUF1043 family)
MPTINLIVGTNLELIKTLLEQRAVIRETSFNKIDFAKNLVKFNSHFIHSITCLDEITNTYSAQKQHWL